MSNDVYVVGTDMIKFGRFPERTVPELGAQAALMALDDAGLALVVAAVVLLTYLGVELPRE